VRRRVETDARGEELPAVGPLEVRDDAGLEDVLDRDGLRRVEPAEVDVFLERAERDRLVLLALAGDPRWDDKRSALSLPASR
jgi:hypothetical protein